MIEPGKENVQVIVNTNEKLPSADMMKLTAVDINRQMNASKEQVQILKQEFSKLRTKVAANKLNTSQISRDLQSEFENMSVIHHDEESETENEDLFTAASALEKTISNGGPAIVNSDEESLTLSSWLLEETINEPIESKRRYSIPDAMEDLMKTAQTHIDSAITQIQPLADDTMKKMKPYADRTIEHIQPIANSTIEKMQPFVDDTMARMGPFYNQFMTYIHNQFPMLTSYQKKIKELYNKHIPQVLRLQMKNILSFISIIMMMKFRPRPQFNLSIREFMKKCTYFFSFAGLLVAFYYLGRSHAAQPVRKKITRASTQFVNWGKEVFTPRTIRKRKDDNFTSSILQGNTIKQPNFDE